MLNFDQARSLFDYDPETGILVWRATGRRAGSNGDRGYRSVEVENKKYREHRVIWLWMTGDWPPDQVDHDNQDRADNRWANLNDSTQTKNQRNRTLQKNNTSGVPGVAWMDRDQRWRARIKLDGKYKHLGHFKIKDHAIAARREAEILNDFHENHGRK